MINSVFTDRFNFLVSSLNNISRESGKGKNEKPSDALKRLLDDVHFIYNKKAHFSVHLYEARDELIQMKTEAKKLKNEISNKNSLLFIIEYLIESLIQEVDIEIKKRSNNEDFNKKAKNPNAIKVKIFKSAFSDVVEKEMNDFLNNNNVQITNTLQNIEKDVVCITLFFKESEI